MDGVSAGAFTVESFSAAILMPSAAERFIITPPLCTEIIEDTLLCVADSERTHLRAAMGAGLAQPQVTHMRGHREATRERRTATPAAIAGQPLTGALKGTEPTQATGDSPAANELSLDANQARRAQVVSAAAAVGSRAESLRMEQAVRTVADTLAADMPTVGAAAVGDTVAAVTVVADMEAGAKCFVSSPFLATSKERSRSGLYVRPFGRSRGLVDGYNGGNPKRLPRKTPTR
jgi:hypothetical protein